MTVEIFGTYHSIFEFIVVLFFLLATPALLFTKAKVRSKKLLELYLFTILLFLFSILLSSFSAINEKAAVKALLKWIEIFGLSVLVFLYCSSMKRFKQIWWLLVLVFASDILVVIIKAPLLHYGINYSILRQQFPAYGLLFLLSLVMPFSVRSRSVTLLSGLLSISIILSLTRGAWLGLLIIGIYWLWKSRNSSRTRSVVVIGLLILGLGLALFAVPGVRNAFHTKIQSSFTLQSASNEERLGLAIASLKMFAERPITGVGAGNFSTYLLSNGIPKFISSRNPQTLTPHNFFLQVAAENGLIGLLAFLVLPFVLYKILFSSVMPSEETLYIQGLKFYFISLLIALLFGYIAGETRLTLGLYIGLVLSCLRIGVLVRQNWVKEDIQ